MQTVYFIRHGTCVILTDGTYMYISSWIKYMTYFCEGDNTFLLNDIIVEGMPSMHIVMNRQ